MSSIFCPHCKFEMALKGAKPGHYWPVCQNCGQKFSLTIPLEGNPIAVTGHRKPASATLPPTGAPRPNVTAAPMKRDSIVPSPPVRVRNIAPAEVEQGPELVGRLGGYDLKQKLGQGGMGAVYLARQISLDRDVALKVLAPALAEDAEFVSRFTREAYAAAQLTHHNVVQIHDIGLETNQGTETNFFSMEFVNGKTLSGLLRETGKLDAEAAVGYTLQAARGLKFAHDHGLIHRDVKPDNLLVNDQGILKVADLGLVKRLGITDPVTRGSSTAGSGSAGVTQLSMSMGTPAYMPPEQARDAANVDARADIYSLGCTLYDLLVGRPPFVGKTAMEVMTKHATEQAVPPDRLVKHVPGALSFIVMKMMAKRPEDRYQTMGQAIAALEGWLGVEPGKPFSPREEHVKVIEDAATQFNASKWAKLRANLIRAFFVLSIIAIVVLALPAVGHPMLAGGMVGFVVTATVIYQLIWGAANRSPLLGKVRLLIFSSRLSDWLTWIGFIALGVLLLVAFDMQWVWLGFAIAAGVSAAVFYFTIDLLLAKHRRVPLVDAENLLKEMRLRGLDENSLRQFVCKYSGHRWEEFYESLFGYDAKLQARQHWGRGERGRNRHKHAVWRESIIDWIERKLRHRRLEREKRLLAKLDARAMTAQGVELNIAAKKAKRNAERLVAKAEAVRETAFARASQTALPTQSKGLQSSQPSEVKTIARNWAHDDSIEVHANVPRVHVGYLRRRFGTPLDMVLGKLVRVVLGMMLLVGFGLWWNQNSGAQARRHAEELAGTREEVTETLKSKDLTTAIKTFKGFGAGMKGDQPLRVAMIPDWICDAVGSWNGGLAGGLLIISAFCSGTLLGFTTLLAAATALFGDRLHLQLLDGNAQAAAIAAVALWMIGMLFFREQRSE